MFVFLLKAFYYCKNYILYKGDFLSFKYDGKGTLYFKGENKILTCSHKGIYIYEYNFQRFI